MENNLLPAKPRHDNGKGAARKIRFLKRIPGVFYYSGTDNIPISVDYDDLRKILLAKPSLIMLEIEGHNPRECVIRELQRNPVDDALLHIDLLGIKRGQRLIVTVPVRLEGLPVGVKSSGGILQKGLSELDIKCLPKDIPQEITVDVTELNIGQSVYVRDIESPLFELLVEGRAVVATVVPPTVIKAVVEPGEEVEEEEEEAASEEEEPPAEK